MNKKTIDINLSESSVILKHATRLIVWLIVVIALLNAYFFVRQVTSPVIQSDAWYFLDVFLRKAIDGHLNVADFFVRRSGADHAQPFYKVALLLEWRYFHLDFMVEALIGLIAAVGCIVIFHALVLNKADFAERGRVGYIVWASISALLLSMNWDGAAWTWSLVTLGYVSFLTVLLYLMVAFYALKKNKFILLFVATLVMGASGDDLGLMAVIGVIFTFLLARFNAPVPAPEQMPVLKAVGAIFLSILIVRVGYTFTPVVGVTRAGPLFSHVALLPDRFFHGGWWKWVVYPLIFPVIQEAWLQPSLLNAYDIVKPIIVVLLLAAHICFWRKALRERLKINEFVAVGLMLISYEQIVGIIIGRVAANGNDYLNQPRYEIMYAEPVIALLLMWAGSGGDVVNKSLHRILNYLAVAGCFILIALQIPISVHAWNLLPYERVYQIRMAEQINTLAQDPSREVSCLPELPFCKLSDERRGELARLLRSHQLNVFSIEVRKHHKYLPLFPQSMDDNNTPHSRSAVGRD